VMAKMHAESLAELVRMYDLLESSMTRTPRNGMALPPSPWRPSVPR